MIPVKAGKKFCSSAFRQSERKLRDKRWFYLWIIKYDGGVSIMSLKIEKKNTETLALVGRLDTVTAPELEAEISAILPTVESLVLDMEKLEYISSAGLRVILKTQKALTQKAGLKLINVSDDVREVFDITGFSDFLTIEWAERNEHFMWLIAASRNRKPGR